MVEDKEETVAKCREVVSGGQTAFGGVQTNTYTLATPSECVSAKKCAEGFEAMRGIVGKGKSSLFFSGH